RCPGPSDSQTPAGHRVLSRAPSPRSVLRPGDRRVPRDRPHWAARLENVKNVTVGSLLRHLGWDLRLQPFHGYGSNRRARILAKVRYASPATPADFYDQPVHDMRTIAVRGWRNFAGQVAPHRTVTSCSETVSSPCGPTVPASSTWSSRWS